MHLYTTTDFEQKFTYSGDDLGARWRKSGTAFRVWAPTAERVSVKLYKSGGELSNDEIGTVSMAPGSNGTWLAEVPGDLNGVYYTYLVSFQDHEVEACDPYARAVGVNGRRAMVVDLDAASPSDWEDDRDPNAGKPFTDAVIYEIHIRDLSIHSSSGIRNAGKYLGLAESGTVNAQGIPTGLDHLRELGITHLHILPFYDYGSVDEARLDIPQYNWGYDPMNFNAPEGSYSTDPCHGEVRIRELKTAIQALHRSGISVIMDVVYNHVFHAADFCFNQIVPGYFSRQWLDGTLSNGSGCGNDTASERPMVRKFIVDSVKYWAEEYHIDGFRFDLAGLMDVDTINAIVDCVHREHPNVVFYGEGWSLPTAVSKPGVQLAVQRNASLTPGFSYFSDLLRDTLRGSIFLSNAPGFLAGATGMKKALENSYMGNPGWAVSPAQVVNYAACHDNHTLMDRLILTAPQASFEERVKMNQLSAAIVLTAQGIPFIHAGEEMLRSKRTTEGEIVENSYCSPDCVNAIRWNELSHPACQQTFHYYKGLIALRKAHPALRLRHAQEVKCQMRAVPLENPHAAAFHMGIGTGDPMYAVFNAGQEPISVRLPRGRWAVCVDGEQAGTRPLRTVSGSVFVPPVSACILCGSCAGEAES